jgi:seryl-tRNA synthetase
MLDIKFIRENKDLIRAAAEKKHIDFDVEDLIRVDSQRTQILSAVEDMRAKQNATSKEISTADGLYREGLLRDMKSLKEGLQKREEELKETMVKWRALMLRVPNVPDMTVPDGASDADNLEIRRWGEVPKFSFWPKTHVDLLKQCDMGDLDRGAKVAGFRGYFLKNDGALLSFAIWQFVMNSMVKKGFTPMVVPSMLRKESFMGTGYLPQSEEDLYKTQDDLYLAGTAEVGTMGYFSEETLELSDLPKKMISFSPCFRREAGAHGKDTSGIIRVHEFYKLEQVVLCEANHETSVKFHEELTQNAEELLRDLKLPYRVVVNCGADLGLGQVKKYDIEAWVPSENKYRETHSSSYFHDFQTRRLNIRYRDEEGKLRFVHSLNNTALATPRVLVAIIENYQNEDGSIRVPEVLEPYMHKKLIIPKTNNETKAL